MREKEHAWITKMRAKAVLVRCCTIMMALEKWGIASMEQLKLIDFKDMAKSRMARYMAIIEEEKGQPRPWILLDPRLTEHPNFRANKMRKQDAKEGERTRSDGIRVKQ